MKIEKIELKNRAFIPYKIEITVESEEEHNKFKAEAERIMQDRKGLFWSPTRQGDGFVSLIIQFLKPAK